MDKPIFPIWDRIDLLCDLARPRQVVRPSVPEEFLRSRSVVNHQAVRLGSRGNMHDKAEDLLLWISGAMGVYGNLWLDQKRVFLDIIKRFYCLNDSAYAHHGDASWVVVQSCRRHLASRLMGFEQKPLGEPTYLEGNYRPRSPRTRTSGDLLRVQRLLWVSRDGELSPHGRLAHIHIRRRMPPETLIPPARETWWCLAEDASDGRTLMECRIPAGMNFRTPYVNYAKIFTLVRLCGQRGFIDRIAFEVAPESGGILSHREAHLPLQMSLAMDANEHDFLMEAAGVSTIGTY